MSGEKDRLLRSDDGSEVRPFADLEPPYTTIVADPPWRYIGKSNLRGDAEQHYSTMTVAEIAYLPVRDIAADDAHLWLWTTNALMEDAHRVVRTWGFTPLTIVTWCKPGPGVGHYLRNNTEHVILASRGRPLTPDVKPLSTWFQWSRGAHSEKPAAFYEVVEQVSPGPYLEMFARRMRLGWDGWGHGYERHTETPHDTEAPSLSNQVGHASVREGSNPPGRVAGLARTATHDQRSTPFPYGADSQEEADAIAALGLADKAVTTRPDVGSVARVGAADRAAGERQ